MNKILNQIEFIKRGIMHHVEDFGNKEVFDLINKDLDDLKDMVDKKKLEIQNYVKHDESLVKQGSKHPNSKLTEDKVENIKKRKKLGYTDKEIGDLYGVHRKTINNILTYKTWAHVN